MSEFKCVPVEPTDEMVLIGAGHAPINTYQAEQVYKAMLAAVPEQPSPAETFLCEKEVMNMAFKTIADAHTDIRNAALEEAAAALENHDYSGYEHFGADDIRALKSQPAQTSDSNMVEKHQIKNQPSDTEMLDWLESNKEELRDRGCDVWQINWINNSGDYQCIDYVHSVRGAIKAAMRAYKEYK